MEESGKYNDVRNKEKSMFAQTLMLDMGSKFKFLIQHKGIQKPRLTGLLLAKTLD